MKKVYLIAGMISLSLGLAEAQQGMKLIVDKEGKLHAIPTQTTYDIKIPEVTYKSYTPITEHYRRMSEKYTYIYEKYNEYSPSGVTFLFMPQSEADRPMNMNTLSAAYRPFFNPYTPMLIHANPMALDYNEAYYKALSDNTLFGVNGVQETWPGLGGMNVVDLSITQKIGRFSVTGGSFAGRFYTPFTPNPDFFGGFNILTRYEVSDYMAIKAWGSYAFYGKNGADPFMRMNPALNRTNVGGSVEFNINDNFGFGIGVNYEYMPMQNRMKPQYLFYPTKIGGSRIGIMVGGN